MQNLLPYYVLSILHGKILDMNMQNILNFKLNRTTWVKAC